jgi:hypothetical protein
VLLVAGHRGNAEVTFSGQGTSFSANGSLQIGYRQWRDDSGVADLEVALPPVGLAFPCKGTNLRTVPQLMLLDEVNTQNEWFVQIRYDVKLMCESFVSYFEVELI